ncbi:ring canal kelch homolog isoform X2 [Metopolophium dirhodum]|uniref:ring canal kelch homolog isoform X2 n=1 Tax=Metopolophium dirhodum TaxID=44670 RepID=UPI00298FB3DD|nr:ring canal kelch homolog isoform X2 [Metopolophium dirhodum]
MEDTAVQNCSLGSIPKQVAILDSTYCEYATFENCSHINGVFKGLQSLRENKVFCDIELETDDGTIVFGHKNVLVSASPYFHAMFTRFEESTKDHVVIKEIDSTILKLLVDFIYNGKITVTLENVQLHYVEGVCCEFLQTQLQPSNCLGIKSFAELHSCMELLSSSEAYIKKNFLEIVKCDEFLFLPFEEVIKLISCEDLNVSFEEKVFECVINWVKYELNCRKDILPKLMEQVRLPLVSKKYILKEVLKEPLLNESSKCKDYVIEALNFHLIKTEPLCNIPENFRCKPRPGALQKVVLAFFCSYNDKEDYKEVWLDPSTNKWHFAPKMNTCCVNAKSEVIVVKDNFLFSFVSTNFVSMMYMLDLSVQFPLWILNIPMLLNRKDFGIGIIDNCIFVVGGAVPDVSTETYNKVEVYDVSIHEWKKVSSMTTKRKMIGVGVLSNFLYVVGGCDGSVIFNSVECYDPSLDTWSNIAEMSQRRYGAGVCVLNGVMYVVGGNDGSVDLKSAEIYSPCDGVWYTISDIHHSRNRPVVIAFNGLIYAMGGVKRSTTFYQSIEIYNPNTDTWVFMELDTNMPDYIIYAGVVIDRPPHFKTH